MKYKILFLALATLSVPLVSGCSHKETSSQNTVDQAVHEDLDGYWTCPMHPQVHQHEKGQCPICGMNLTHIDSPKKPEKRVPDTSNIPSSQGMQMTDKQLGVVAIGRYTVSRKDLTVSIPVSGNILSPEEIALQIYESDLALVNIDSPFSGFSSASPQQLLKGKIKRINSIIDPTTRTLKVFGNLDHPLQNRVNDGGFHGEITAQLKNQIVIPEDAVLHTGTRDLVYLISPDNQVHPKAVVLGSKSLEEYQVFAELKEGDVISTGPNFLLDSESKIRGGNDQASH